jgi:transposase
MRHASRQDRHRARQAAQRHTAQSAAATVGVDAGKHQHCLVVRPKGGVDSKPFTFPTIRIGFDVAVERISELSDGAAPADVLVGIEFAGVYGFTFAHYLADRGFTVVSVLPADTKAWKQVRHRQRLKTDEKDAATIVDLVAQGQYVPFPFLDPRYAELRHLASARERLSMLRTAAISRLRGVLQTVFPEFEPVFSELDAPTPTAVLRAFPGPDALLAAPRQKVMQVLRKASRGHAGAETWERLRSAALSSVALPGTRAGLRGEIALLLDQLRLYRQQLRALERSMEEVMADLPEAACLMSIPGVAPVAAGVFLGSLGDVHAYRSSRQVLKLAGMSLIVSSSGTRVGNERLSKHGRPILRRLSFMLGLRAVRSDGLLREPYLAMLDRNGGRKMPAVVAMGRRMLCLMFAVAKGRRTFTREPLPAPGSAMA